MTISFGFLSIMGWVRNARPSRSHVRPAIIISVTLICLVFLLPKPAWIKQGPSQLIYGAQYNDVADDTPTPASASEIEDSNPTDHCADRFGTEYLRGYSQMPTNYCDTNSTARLVCFSRRVSDHAIDSFCIGGPSNLNTREGKFTLDCVPRDLDQEEIEKDLPQLKDFPEYWFNTGPRAIMTDYVKLERVLDPVANAEFSASDPESQGLSMMVLREDSNQNLWHTMMQIMSLTFSLDVLRTTVDPTTGKLFVNDKALEDSRIVFLDDLDDGPYYDLWTLFTGKPSVRLNETSSHDLSPTLLMPLPGGSNPFWQGDWVDISCGKSELLETYSRRVLEFYNISDSPPRSERPLTLTWVDRKHKRRLVDKDIYWAALKAKYPSINMQLVDFATMPLSEQIQIGHSTDIFAGIHGAGLTHGMFMPPNSTLVEILPPPLMHKGFHNMANFLGHHYFGTHGSEHDSPKNNGDWHDDDVYIEEDRFMDLMAEAIASVGGRAG